MFQWQTAGLDITSTVEEVDAPRRIAGGGPTQGIVAVHVWTFEERQSGVLVHTEESWEGDPVNAQTEALQAALDGSLLPGWRASSAKRRERSTRMGQTVRGRRARTLSYLSRKQPDTWPDQPTERFDTGAVPLEDPQSVTSGGARRDRPPGRSSSQEVGLTISLCWTVLGAPSPATRASNVRQVTWLVDDDNPGWSRVRNEAIQAALRMGRDYAAALGVSLASPCRTGSRHRAAGRVRRQPSPARKFSASAAAGGGHGGEDVDTPTLDPMPQDLSAVIEARFRTTPATVVARDRRSRESAIVGRAHARSRSRVRWLHRPRLPPSAPGRSAVRRNGRW